jgi:ethanolamine utilization protein EutM
MGSDARMSVLSGPTPATRQLASRPPVHIPLLGIDDSLVPDSQISGEDAMRSSDALGLIETQGLVAALHATDEMLKASAVELVGKEKIGAAYVTIMVRGDVAAVQAAIAAGRKTVEQLGGTLILADVIPRPHPELAALLPG